MGLTVRAVLLAGPSGSGKSYIARRTGLPVLCLDNFYKDADDPTLPRANGAIDWESPLAWDPVAAVETIAGLVRDGRAEVPVYDFGADRRVDSRPIDLGGSPLFIVEGIFAAEIRAECQRRGLLAAAYALRRPRMVTFVRRIARDLAERRKPPGVLIARGIRLLRAERSVLRRQIELGCRPASGTEILGQVAALVAAAQADRTAARRLPRQLGVGRLDDLVYEGESFVERKEGALHGVDREPLQFPPAVTERLDQQGHLPGQ